MTAPDQPQAEALEATWRALPGDMVRHKKGGVYRVLARRLAESYLYLGQPVASGPHTATVTDQVAHGEQIVIYQNVQTKDVWARPARLFDQPERFACISKQPPALFRSLAQQQPTHTPFQTEALAREVHAAWRDGMLDQGREVAPNRMNWNLLSWEDRALDHAIAERLCVVVLAQQPPALALAEENRKLRAAINRMAVRMDSRAEEEGDRHWAHAYRLCADIVSEELADAALAEAGTPAGLPDGEVQP